MPSVKLSPILQDQQFYDTGLPLVAGQLFWYLAGTTTPVTVYKDSNGTIAHSNPIILNSSGRLDNPIWLETGKAYKAVVKDSLSNTIGTPFDNVIGINDSASVIVSEWSNYPGSGTFISATSFSIAGDATGTLTPGRRIKVPVSNGTGTVYANIATSVFAAGTTTITVVNDAGAILDVSMSSLAYGFLSSAHPSYPLLIPAGYVIPFFNTAAPFGWTQVTTHNDKMLRVVSTAGGGSGGIHSAILNDKVPSHTHVDAGHTHTDAGHTHTFTAYQATGGGFAAASATATSSIAVTTASGAANIQSGAASIQANAGATNWQPFYLDMILCAKN